MARRFGYGILTSEALEADLFFEELMGEANNGYRSSGEVGRASSNRRVNRFRSGPSEQADYLTSRQPLWREEQYDEAEGLPDDDEEAWSEFDAEFVEPDPSPGGANAPFAPLLAGAGHWPIITSHPQGRAVSYRTTTGAWIGRQGRSFGANRSNSTRYHLGVDLFGRFGDSVVAIEDGRIVNFFGFCCGSNKTTWALLVQHANVVVNYGEVAPDSLSRNSLRVGSNVRAGQVIGRVGRNPGGSSMIHFEANTTGTTRSYRWLKGRTRPARLLNPTRLLLQLQEQGLPRPAGGASTTATGTHVITTTTTSTTSVDPLLMRCQSTIIGLADASPVVRFRWPHRGQAPQAYLRGMALVYARVYCKWKAGDVFAREMARSAGSDASVDALATYAAEFRAAGMSNGRDGVDTLRHVFVLLIGLGMMESSGQYNVGRDLSASNTSSTTAEAGLFQVSYSVGVGSSTIAGGWLKRQYDVLKLLPYSGLRNVFAAGRGTSSRGQTSGFRTDAGGRFRRFLIMEPALGAEVAALGIRKRVRHWGPLRRRQVTINADVDALLSAVQNAVDRGNCCRPVVPGGAATVTQSGTTTQ